MRSCGIDLRTPFGSQVFMVKVGSTASVPSGALCFQSHQSPAISIGSPSRRKMYRAGVPGPQVGFGHS